MADSQESGVGNPAGIQLVEEEDSPVNSSINTTPRSPVATRLH